ncbi:MAG: heavy metal sensor histidine kinase [Pseudomonadota bacterium]|nr:heavy metal sensor histidine kinase [Pseudomonadota bacterium]
MRLSLTTRLTAFFTLASAAVLLGLGWLTTAAIHAHFIELDSHTLQDKIHLTQEIIARSASNKDLQQRLDEALSSHQGLFVRVQDGAGRLLYATPGFVFPDSALAQPGGADHVRPLASDAHPAHPLAGAPHHTRPLVWHDRQQEFHALQAAGQLSGRANQPVRILAAVDTEHHAQFIADFQKTLLGYMLLATLASGLLGWGAARRGLAPLRAMKARAAAVTARKLDQRMPVDAVPVEMADLAASLNEMLARLELDFNRLSEFSSDLAHELRTPISNLMTQTQVALSQRRPAEEYRDILASNAEELQRMARMVSDMLFLAKAEHGLALASRESFQVAGEVQALFDFYEALAEEKGVHLKLEGEGRINGDRLMFRRAISNLLSNALRYTPAGGQVRVEIAQAPQATTVSVENTGADISPDVLPRLFDRFFRADKSRNHPESDGAGLGLSITRAIAQAHGGQAWVACEQGKIRFSVSFADVP